jgi:hypothetical protein
LKVEILKALTDVLRRCALNAPRKGMNLAAPVNEDKHSPVTAREPVSGFLQLGSKRLAAAAGLPQRGDFRCDLRCRFSGSLFLPQFVVARRPGLAPGCLHF